MSNDATLVLNIAGTWLYREAVSFNTDRIGDDHRRASCLRSSDSKSSTCYTSHDSWTGPRSRYGLS